MASTAQNRVVVQIVCVVATGVDALDASLFVTMTINQTRDQRMWNRVVSESGRLRVCSLHHWSSCRHAQKNFLDQLEDGVHAQLLDPLEQRPHCHFLIVLGE